MNILKKACVFLLWAVMSVSVNAEITTEDIHAQFRTWHSGAYLLWDKERELSGDPQYERLKDTVENDLTILMVMVYREGSIPMVLAAETVTCASIFTSTYEAFLHNDTFTEAFTEEDSMELIDMWRERTIIQFKRTRQTADAAVKYIRDRNAVMRGEINDTSLLEASRRYTPDCLELNEREDVKWILYYLRDRVVL